MNNKKVIKNLIWMVISTVLAVVTIRVVLKQNKDMSVDELLSLMSSSDRLFLVFAAVASLLYVWFEGIAIRSILKNAGHKRSRRNGLIYSTSDVYFSAITPSATGGQPASAFFMIRDGIPTGITTATLVLNLLMYNASIIVLGVISVIISPRGFMAFNGVSKFLIILGFVILSCLSLGFFILLKKERLIFKPVWAILTFLHRHKLIKDVDKKKAALIKVKNDYKMCASMISGRKRILVGAFIWNLLQRASQIMVPMFIYVALGGAKIRMASVFAKQCLITIGYNFIPIPGGMGVSDYLMVDGFNNMMMEHMAFNVELISRGFSFYICVFISGVITLIGYIAGRKNK